MEAKLRKIIFPDRSLTGKKAGNDLSDLRHIAYCIYEGISGFITLENKILEAKAKIEETFSLKVLSLNDLGLEILDINVEGVDDLSNRIHANDIQINTQPSSQDLDRFLSKVGGLDKAVGDVLKSRNSENILHFNIAESKTDQLSLFFVSKKLPAQLDAFIILNSSHDGILPVLDHYLETFSRIYSKFPKLQLNLYATVSNALNDLCLRRGYQIDQTYEGKQIKFTKLQSPRLITTENWHEFQLDFKNKTGVALPDLIPNFDKVDANDVEIELEQKNQFNTISLYQFETLLSPSCFLLPQRTGVILPIMPGYAEGLVSKSKHILPFPIKEEAYLHLEKAYFRSPRNNSKIFNQGMPIIFYESGSGRGAIGCARITSSQVVSVDKALSAYQRNGVLSKAKIESIAYQGNVHVITFDNFIEFEKPLSISELKDLDTGQAGFIAPEKINFSKLSKILHRGLNLPMKDVLLSIKPVYANKIIDGSKTIELRRKPISDIEKSKVWIYSTLPEQTVTALASVKKVTKGTPEEIWRKFGSKACIGKSDYDTYFNDCNEAYALELTNVTELRRKIKLTNLQKSFPDFTPPQFFKYVDHESDLHRYLKKALK